jgi:hypothetical protein
MGAGIDGDWQVFPEPRMPVPVAGECLDGPNTRYSLPVDSLLTTVGCAASHVLEVVYVGRFTGTAEAATSAPAADSEAARAAFAECDTAARRYLGDDWRTGNLQLRYSTPTVAKWEGGARYFSCSLFETQNPDGDVRTRTGSVKGGLSGDRPLAMRCFNQVGTGDARGFYTNISDVSRVDCDQPHTAEYAGTVYPPNRPYPATDEEMDRVRFGGCDEVVASFLSLSATAFTRRRDVSYLAWSPDKDKWALGDRTFPCLVTVSSATPVRGSLKLLGGRPLPR